MDCLKCKENIQEYLDGVFVNQEDISKEIERHAPLEAIQLHKETKEIISHIESEASNGLTRLADLLGSPDRVAKRGCSKNLLLPEIQKTVTCITVN